MSPTPVGGESIRKHSVIISGHRTSISLEDAFWEGLREIAAETGTPINHMVTKLDSDGARNLSSTIRLFVLDYFRQRS